MKGSLLYLSMDQKLHAQYAIPSGSRNMKQKAVMFGKVYLAVCIMEVADTIID